MTTMLEQQQAVEFGKALERFLCKEVYFDFMRGDMFIVIPEDEDKQVFFGTWDGVMYLVDKIESMDDMDVKVSIMKGGCDINIWIGGVKQRTISVHGDRKEATKTALGKFIKKYDPRMPFDKAYKANIEDYPDLLHFREMLTKLATMRLLIAEDLQKHLVYWTFPQVKSYIDNMCIDADTLFHSITQLEDRHAVSINSELKGTKELYLRED